MRKVNYGGYRAPRVHHIVEEKLLKGNLIRKPLWFDAVKMFPPVHRMVNTIQQDPTRFSTIMNGQNVDNEEQKHTVFNDARTIDCGRYAELERYASNLPSRKWRNAKKYSSPAEYKKMVMEAAKTFAFPENIVYAEDKLRERFYRDHPLERVRPQTLSADQSHSVKTVEDVVAHQQMLMKRQNNPLTEDEAYAGACQEFYKSRLREEAEIQGLATQAAALGADSETSSGETEQPQMNGKKDTESVESSIPILDKWISIENKAMEEAVRVKREEMERQKERALLSKRATSV